MAWKDDRKQWEKQNQKTNLKNENNLRDLLYNIKCTNIHITGVPEEGRECGWKCI